MGLRSRLRASTRSRCRPARAAKLWHPLLLMEILSQGEAQLLQRPILRQFGEGLRPLVATGVVRKAEVQRAQVRHRVEGHQRLDAQPSDLLPTQLQGRAGISP
eukprot:GGOE01059216.1.p2 GENE.GGOE01059216.1~~GGOE01059216.1.p2  ORF type:complete len:103 (+),score=6.63 GGOE01059216.1:120-428(+)